MNERITEEQYQNALQVIEGYKAEEKSLNDMYKSKLRYSHIILPETLNDLVISLHKEITNMNEALKRFLISHPQDVDVIKDIRTMIDNNIKEDIIVDKYKDYKGLIRDLEELESNKYVYNYVRDLEDEHQKALRIVDKYKNQLKKSFLTSIKERLTKKEEQGMKR